MIIQIRVYSDKRKFPESLQEILECECSTWHAARNFLWCMARRFTKRI